MNTVIMELNRDAKRAVISLSDPNGDELYNVRLWISTLMTSRERMVTCSVNRGDTKTLIDAYKSDMPTDFEFVEETEIGKLEILITMSWEGTTVMVKPVPVE